LEDIVKNPKVKNYSYEMIAFHKHDDAARCAYAVSRFSKRFLIEGLEISVLVKQGSFLIEVVSHASVSDDKLSRLSGFCFGFSEGRETQKDIEAANRCTDQKK